MHQLKTAYTVYFNRRHQVVGHLFQGRFKSTVIEAEKYLLEVSRYLHLNPVRGKVLGQGTPMERRKRVRAYRWSKKPKRVKKTQRIQKYRTCATISSLNPSKSF